MPPAPDMMTCLALLAAVGVLGGFMSGLLGVGGGMIFVPALLFALPLAGFPADSLMHVVIGSSLASIVATTFLSARAHHGHGAVDMGLVRLWAPLLVAGVAAGSVLAGFTDGAALKKIFGCIALLLALHAALGRDRAPGAPPPRFLTSAVEKSLVAVTGIAVAMTGGAGGIITVPLMRARGVPLPRAVGTAAVLSCIVATGGMLGYIATGWPHRAELPPFSLGYVNFAAAACIVAGSVWTVPLGVRVSRSLTHAAQRRVLASALALVGLRMLLS